MPASLFFGYRLIQIQEHTRDNGPGCDVFHFRTFRQLKRFLRIVRCKVPRIRLTIDEARSLSIEQVDQLGALLRQRSAREHSPESELQFLTVSGTAALYSQQGQCASCFDEERLGY